MTPGICSKPESFYGYFSLLSRRCPVDQLSIPDRIAHSRKRSNVPRRVRAQGNKVRDQARSDPPEPAPFSKFLGRRGRERGKDLAKRHSRLGHQSILVAGIILVHTP